MQDNRYRVSAEELEIVKHTDLPALLESLGYHVTKKGRYHSTTEMDSLRIKERRTWFRYSEQVGGDAIAFLQHFHGMEFVDAVQHLLAFNGYSRDAPVLNARPTPPALPAETGAVEFALPERSAEHRHVYPMDLAYLCHLNQVVGANLIYGSGYLRKIPVRMGGTTWVPDMPIESMIKEEMADILSMESATERAITLTLWSMRRQMFPDGNKRTSMLAGNQVMIQNGCGIISVPIEEQGTFTEKLVRFYETNDMEDLKAFVYDRCIDGTDFEPVQEQSSADRFLKKDKSKKPKGHER